MTPRRAPAGLRGGGRRLWQGVTSVYELRADELPLLEQMCRTVDDLAEMQVVLARDGVTVSGSRGQVRPHPLLAEIRGARLVLARLGAQLGLPDPGAGASTSTTPAQRRASKAARARWGAQREVRHG